MTEDKIIDFDKLDWCFIHEGNGRGSKLLQAHLDGGQDVLMLPGYACMYFFPFLEKYKKKTDSNEILNNFYKYFDSIFDTRKNPGSESLDTLGKNKNNFLITNKKKFKNNFNFYLKKKEKNITEIFKAIHFAYFSTNKKNFNKKVIISHVHVFKYFPKYIYNKFNEPKIIVMIDDPIAHFLRRDKNSYLRPNFNKFFYSDFIISIFYTFYQNVNLMTEGLQSLKIFGSKNVRAVMYNDLKNNISKIMPKICKFLDISYKKKINNTPTFGSLKWNFTYYKEDISKHSVKKFYDLINYSLILSEKEKELIEFIYKDFYNFYYKVNKKYTTFKNFEYCLKIFYFFNRELWSFKFFYNLKNLQKFKNSIFIETKKIPKIIKRYHGNNLFYNYKWTSLVYKLDTKLYYLVYRLFKNYNKKYLVNKIIQTLYVFDKILFLTFAPIILFMNYFKRVFFFLKLLLRNILNMNFFPQKL